MYPHYVSFPEWGSNLKAVDLADYLQRSIIAEPELNLNSTNWSLHWSVGPLIDFLSFG
jgi:hypothetical protein